MKNHGVGTMANVEDMCTLLQVSSYTVNTTSDVEIIAQPYTPSLMCAESFVVG
jgi:hypothetical protein